MFSLDKFPMFPDFTGRMLKKLPKRDLPMKKVWVQTPGLIMGWLMHYTSKAGLTGLQLG